MQETARVVSVEGDIATVVPLDIEVCIGCSNSECKKNGNVFTAYNSGKLDLYPGAEVRIRARARNQALQAGLSIGLPVLAAASGYGLTAGMLPEVCEGVLVGVSLAALVCAGAAVAVFHHIGSKDLPEIYEIIGSCSEEEQEPFDGSLVDQS
jgi:hypothetical protein